MALLKFQDETGAEQFVHVGPDRPEITIGRVRTCDLVTTNITVSRRHASVTFQDGKFILRDLNSANGVFYNKQRVGELVLKDGDSMLVGSMPVFFELEPSDMKGHSASAAVAPSRDPVHARPTVAAPGTGVQGQQEAAPAPAPGPAPAPAPKPPVAQAPAAARQPAPAQAPAPKPPVAQAPVPRPAPAPRAPVQPAPAPRPAPVASPVAKAAPAPAAQPAPEQQDRAPRNVPAAFRADWKPSAAPRPAPAATAKPSVQRSVVARPASDPGPSVASDGPRVDDELDSTLVQQPGQGGRPVQPVTAVPPKPVSPGESSGRTVELEKALELERADRLQIAEALKVAQERYYDASERADIAEAALIDVKSEMDLISQENREMADRADQLERENADLLQEIDDLRRERTENSSSASSVQQQISSLQAEVGRLKGELSRRELEVSSLKSELEQARTTTQPASSGDLDAALRQIEELKMSNKGYLKRIGRLMEEQEKAVPCGVIVTPEVIGLADRLVDLAGESIDAASLARSLVSELKAAGAADETVLEMRSAIASLADSVNDLRKVSADMQTMLKPPVQD
ncbi:MAG TPA: FHA domain-containing protein [Myxococcota bacterium]|mgnify:CR=1 FL=1|nr:FHA domain-containing protein [Myxococcota bacterium]HOH77006.1 FHA domain-containing protein [Myxococcota bacterium]